MRHLTPLFDPKEPIQISRNQCWTNFWEIIYDDNKIEVHEIFLKNPLIEELTVLTQDSVYSRKQNRNKIFGNKSFKAFIT